MTYTRTSGRPGTAPRSALRLGLVGLFGLALAAAACATTSPPGVEKEAKPADLDALQTVGGKAAGTIVWTSSRAGTPHLYTMRTDGSDVKELTRGNQTDWYPRFSPEGSRILFCRSRDEAFVRESAANDADTWDIYTINTDGSALTKVVDNACWGSWINPEEILFVRGSKLMRATLGASGDQDEAADTGEKRVLDFTRHDVFDGAVVRAPEMSRDGHSIAMTLGGAHRQTGVWNLKEHTWTVIGQGATLSWAPDGASVVWVNAAGKDGAEIARLPLPNGERAEGATPEVLVDVPGKRSREAFPRVSNDGKWLVFGAAIHDLEHDLEDYEIYLWEIGTPLESAARETFHTANDRWPDVFVGPPGKAPALTDKAKSDDDDDDTGAGASKTGAGDQPAGDAAGEGAKPEAPAEPKDDGFDKQDNGEKADTSAAPSGEDTSASDAAEPVAKPKAKKKRRH